LSHDTTDDDRRKDTNRPNLTRGLAAEVWRADDLGSALDRWRDGATTADDRRGGGRE
jgi:hypothetical protein